MNMNKQEAVNQLRESLLKMVDNIENENDFNKGYRYATQHCFDVINEIDEPKKVKLPKYVDTWYQGAKYNGYDLYEAMTAFEIPDKVDTWIQCNSETFAKAWLYGYEIEETKLYRMKHNLTGEYLCFTLNKSFHSDDLNWYTAIQRTQKEWEEMGYWDNNLYEPEEVEK